MKRIICLCACLLLLARPGFSATFVVTSTGDSDTAGTLRWAINSANASPGTNTIAFNISTNTLATISLLSPLPTITNPLIVDGYTEPGSRTNTLVDTTLGGSFSMTYNNANILIELIGNYMTNVIDTTQSGFSNDLFVDRGCFTTVSSNCVFRGMWLHGFFYPNGESYTDLACAILMKNVTGCVVEGNIFGLKAPGGSIGDPNNCGVFVYAGSGNRIGGTNACSRNIIDCDGRDVLLYQSTSNLIAGNLLCGIPVTTPSAQPHGIGDISILITAGSSNNVVGGPDFTYRNYVVGAPVSAVEVDGSSANAIVGNWIGLTPPPFGGVGNFIGITLSNAWNNTIGGASAGASADRTLGNVISGNTKEVWITGSLSVSNTVYGNYIGTDPNGTNTFFPDGEGVVIDNGASSNLLGGAFAATGNLICGHSSEGVLIASNGTSFNLVLNNYIGVGAYGTNALPNYIGVALTGGATNNQIGLPGSGEATGIKNIISANTYSGVLIDGTGTSGNLIQGNFIGSDATGLQAPVVYDEFSTSAVNQGRGVVLQNAAAWNTIGGTPSSLGSGPANLIAFNAGDGVLVYDTATHDTITANAIHDNSGLGINLQPVDETDSTVTPNHPGGGISGPNELLNFPIITNVAYRPYNTVIAGAITNGQPNQNFYVDIYYNPTNDPSGYGQGRYFAGRAAVLTDAAGNALFSVSASGYLAANTLSATATSFNGAIAGSTSEFGPDFSAPVIPVVITNVFQSGTSLSLGFQTYLGQAYTIQTNSDLTTTNWGFYLNTTGDGTIQNFLTPDLALPKLFFRVVEP